MVQALLDPSLRRAVAPSGAFHREPLPVTTRLDAAGRGIAFENPG
jgi:hypothetical protein